MNFLRIEETGEKKKKNFRRVNRLSKRPYNILIINTFILVLYIKTAYHKENKSGH